ncbi:MAG TPA: type II toxin-antitoxin system RelE/ParE family toxin [Fimbriiglobus sp.]|nr:type II toxin-antitoxin system RelE/ParE family toxin [Fimbriiglobus sp.]
MSIIIRADAAQDIRAIVAAFQITHPKSAGKFSVALTRTIEGVERFPLAAPELGPSADGSVVFRFTTIRGFRRFVVIYLPLSDGVDVLRVVDGRRDLSGIIASINP